MGLQARDPIQISLLITLINNDIQRSFQATRLRGTKKRKEKKKENPRDRSIKSRSDRALKTSATEFAGNEARVRRQVAITSKRGPSPFPPPPPSLSFLPIPALYHA